MNYTIQQERLTPEAYIDFLRHTDLGSQYPKERFHERIAILVEKASISLTARDADGALIGVCFGITDFAYWLFITDLGVVREWTGMDGPGRGQSPGARAAPDCRRAPRRRRRRKHHHVHLRQ